MKIDGKTIAQEILEELKEQIVQKGSSLLGMIPNVEPTLAVILLGQDPASLSYIKQKQKAADFLGAKIILKQLPSQISPIRLIGLIREINSNPSVCGIIIQRPLPSHINSARIAQIVAPEKDVDGFHPNSPFTPPVALAVLKILKFIWNPQQGSSLKGMIPNGEFRKWLKSQNILVLGRGETGGKPIANTLKKLGCKITIAHSKTKNTSGLLKKADIIISCVGKPNLIKGNMIKKGAIAIGVGISRQSQIQSPTSNLQNPTYKLVGDFEEESVSKVASFYTPTPGGIGPINVACLMENLMTAKGVSCGAKK